MSEAARKDSGTSLLPQQDAAECFGCLFRLKPDLRSQLNSIKTIPAEDILNAKVVPLKQMTPPPCVKTSSSLRTHSLLVYYVKQHKKQILRMASCQFDGSLAECERLKEDINRKREGYLKPIRKLLVLINPVSGARKSPHIYQTAVAPIMKACDITCEVVTSTKRGDLRNIVTTRGWNEYNGLLVVGGDGSLNEVVNGLLSRAMEECGRDINDKCCQLLPITVPIGIIPTGTGNFLCLHLQGNSDVITSVIHIARGHRRAMNAVTIHTQDRFLHIANLMMHIGFVGDIIHIGESNRWMGVVRNQVASHMAIFSRRLMSVDLTCETVAGDVDVDLATPQPVQQCVQPVQRVQPVQQPVQQCVQPVQPVQRVQQPVQQCVQQPVQQPVAPQLPQPAPMDSSTDHSSFASGADVESSADGAADVMPGPAACSRPGTSLETSAPGVSGMSSHDDTQITVYDDHTEGHVYNIFLPVTQALTSDGRLEARLGAHTMSMVVIKDCSLPQFLKHFIRLRDNTGGLNDFGFVESRQVVSVKLEMTSEHSRLQTWYINSDGESLPMETYPVYFKLHHQVFSMFGPAPSSPEL